MRFTLAFLPTLLVATLPLILVGQGWGRNWRFGGLGLSFARPSVDHLQKNIIQGPI
jgi:hypothetical protein